MSFRPPLPRPKTLSGAKPPLGAPKAGPAPQANLTAASSRPGAPATGRPVASGHCK